MLLRSKDSNNLECNRFLKKLQQEVPACPSIIVKILEFSILFFSIILN